jgi:hypothetical protein
MIHADLVVEGAAQVVTCDPARGGDGVGVVAGGAVAAHGERIVWIGPGGRLGAEVQLVPGGCRLDAAGGAYFYGVNHVRHAVKRGRVAWSRGGGIAARSGGPRGSGPSEAGTG